MYKISLEFNGTAVVDTVTLCATKAQASKWMRDYGTVTPRGHVHVVHKVSANGDTVQVDVAERYMDALHYPANRNAWQTQRGRVAKNTSVYVPAAENRR